jgi:hypothetical protein
MAIEITTKIRLPFLNNAKKNLVFFQFFAFVLGIGFWLLDYNQSVG